MRDLTDMSELIQAIQEQTRAIESLISLLQNDFTEIKKLLALTQENPMRYYLSQENFGGQMQGVVHGKAVNMSNRKGKPPQPFVPQGHSVTCVRCEYQWTPQSRTPQKCPTCRSPWWYPPKWRWRKNGDNGNDDALGTDE